jgi:hypothetical protein
LQSQAGKIYRANISVARRFNQGSMTINRAEGGRSTPKTIAKTQAARRFVAPLRGDPIAGRVDKAGRLRQSGDAARNVSLMSRVAPEAIDTRRMGGNGVATGTRRHGGAVRRNPRLNTRSSRAPKPNFRRIDRADGASYLSARMLPARAALRVIW